MPNDDTFKMRVRPGAREKAAAIQSRFAGYGDNLTDLIHILIDREYARLTRPEQPLLMQIESHADAIRRLIHTEAARLQEIEDAAEIAEIRTSFR